MKKLKILISAYACCPESGSEPGMGWNFVHGLSKYHEVHVIAEKRKWQQPITSFLEEHPFLNKTMKFYFVDKKRNKRLRKIWPPSYYLFYRQWQKEVYVLASKLEELENFDIVHQLNMVGYREPGYLWKIDKPYVWGPVGGLKNSPWRFLPSLGFKGMMFLGSRNIINLLQYHLKKPSFAAKHKKGYIIAATLDDAHLIQKLWNREAEIMVEVGQEHEISLRSGKRLPHEPLRIVWSGEHIPLKNLGLLLKAVKNITVPYELHILGFGLMTEKWQKKAKRLKINDSCVWYGWRERQEALEIMTNGHVFCLTSVKDLTSTVTLEALSLGLPIVCLDHLGFSHVVTKHCGFKIEVSTPSKVAMAMQKVFEKVYYDEPLRQNLGQGALERAAEFSWDKKIERLNDIYFSLINSGN